MSKHDDKHEDEREDAIVTEDESKDARVMRVLHEVFGALHALAHANLSTAPTAPTAAAWRDVANVIGAAIGLDHIGHAAPTVGRQPVVMPPGYKHAIPPKGGAQALHDPSRVKGIKDRDDVRAELDRIGKGKPRA